MIDANGVITLLEKWREIIFRLWNEIWTHNPHSPVALIAHLGEHCTGNTKVVGSNPIQSPKIFPGYFLVVLWLYSHLSSIVSVFFFFISNGNAMVFKWLCLIKHYPAFVNLLLLPCRLPPMISMKFLVCITCVLKRFTSVRHILKS